MTVARMSDPRHEVAAAAQTAPAQLQARGGTHRLKSLALLSRQLAVLVRTGTPLADALNAIEHQIAQGPWKAVVADLHRQVEQGNSLSEAMARHPTWFDPVCLSLITVGESSGNLDELLERLSNLIRQQLKIHRTVIGAMLYPVLLLAVGVAVVAVMVCFVLPRFADLFANLDAPLPPSTKALIAMSEALRADWWIFLGAIVMTLVAAKLYLATAGGRRGLHAAAVSVPYLGELVRNLITARLARLLGVLLDSSVPMLDSLKLLRDSTGNCHYAELIGRAEEAVVRGESLSSALGDSPLINPYVAEALRHGERSGQISPVLLDMAEFMDEENEVVVRTASRLLEPLMLIVLGAIVAVIALSIFMPLFDLTSLTHGGGA